MQQSERHESGYVICSNLNVYLKYSILISHIFTLTCKYASVYSVQLRMSTLIHNKGLQKPLEIGYFMMLL
jgi:hypothetical protein